MGRLAIVLLALAALEPFSPPRAASSVHPSTTFALDADRPAQTPLNTPQTTDESNLPDSEKRIPPGDYCKRVGVRIGPRESRAHSCDCKFSCTIDEHGAVVQHEDASCQAFCEKNGRRCTCHVEEPCPGSEPGNAQMDMHGRVVAVNIAH